MLTTSDIKALDAMAEALAHRLFPGKANVERHANGTLVCIVQKDDPYGSLYQMRTLQAPTFTEASNRISRAIEAVGFAAAV